jgi:endonuclease G
MLDALLCAFHLHCAYPRASKLAAPSVAVTTACPENFQAGRAPVIVNPKIAASSYPLCLSGFALLFSGVTRTPVYSAEHLTAARIDAARGMVRVNPFHAEPQLPVDVRSELSDYRRSGYDRGHMAPNGDMGDDASQHDSFSLANMVPQNHANNAGLWSAIEEATRNTAVADGEVYVVTGPLYQGADLTVLQDRIYVPTGIWKAVYDPASNGAGAYVVDNKPGWDYRRISIDDLTKMTGVDPFPGLSAAVKARSPDLPPPTRGRY